MSVFMGCFLPFLQASIGAMLQVYITNENLALTTIASLFYWTMFAANGKRVALGGWKAITLFIIFASLGTIFGMLIGNVPIF